MKTVTRTQITREELLERLEEMADRAGSISKLAREQGICRGYLINVMGGRAKPGPKVLAIIGADELAR
jgi:DNA-binding phage protein